MLLIKIVLNILWFIYFLFDIEPCDIIRIKIHCLPDPTYQILQVTRTHSYYVKLFVINYENVTTKMYPRSREKRISTTMLSSSTLTVD